MIIFAQIASIIGWLLLVYSYYKDDIDKLLLVQIISSIFYCLSYLFLGAYSGLLVCFIELLKGIGYYKTDSDNLIFLVTLPIYIFMGIFTYDGFISLLPIIGSIIDGFSLTKNKTIATAGSFVSNILWVIYDVNILAYTSAITDAILVISNLFILIFGYSAVLKVHRLRFMHARTFSRNVYNSICKLDKKTYGEDYLWSFDYSKNINDKNPKSLLLVKYHNNIVGYINYIVISNNEYLKIINSDKLIKEYDISNIINFKKRKKNYVIIDSINVKHEFQNDSSVELIIKKIKNMIVTKYNDGYEIENIICPVVSHYEKKIMDKAGFRLLKEYSGNECLYVIDNKTIDELYLKNVLKREFYKVYTDENITSDMLKSIRKIDSNFFEEDYLWSIEHQLELFNKNKKSLIMVAYKDKIVGYINYLVVTKEKYNDMLNSNIIVDKFSLEEITKFKKNRKNYITINSIVINKRFQNGYAIRLLTNRLKKQLAKLDRDNYKVASINGFAISNDGRKFLENLGFTKIKDLKDGNSLYLLEDKELKEYLYN